MIDRRTARWPFLLAFPMLAVTGCSRDVAPQDEDRPAPESGGVPVINEILFSPAGDGAQFVELKGTAGSGAVAGFYLVNEEGEKFVLPQDSPELEPDALLLIVFDGQDRIDGTTIHAARDSFLSERTGSVDLFAPDGRKLDRVAWGTNVARAVNPGRGGVHDEFDAGSSIGRFPLSTRPDSPLEWITFSGKEVTPGARNPNPRVEVLLPLDGAFFPRASIELSWYPVPGAASYEVEISEASDFASLVAREAVETPGYSTPDLQPGEYFWRVRAVFEDGSAASFSPVSSFTISASQVPLTVRQTSSFFFSEAFAAETAPPLEEGVLPVPMIYQHKDTSMLLLESQFESGTHAWDRDHGTLDPTDPADNMNCALASTAMVNNFAGGNLSQDRIGYEIRKNDWMHDPVFDAALDLNYGQGFSLDEIDKILAFAFNGSAVTRQLPTTADAFWATVKQEIDAGRPIVAAIPGHAIVINGYYRFSHTGPNARWVTLNDPWSGRYLVNLNRMSRVTHFWLVADMRSPRDDEPEIRRDSDGDGMVDFDETERFKTDPNHPDKDRDGVEDKTEVYASVFDPVHGYVVDRGGWRGRDLDSDGFAMELDVDSDDGGCDDGYEDENRDGRRAGAETSNFDSGDDEVDEHGKCSKLWIGTMEASHHPAWMHLIRTTVEVRLREVHPNLPPARMVGAIDYVDLVDAGSLITQTHSNVGGNCVISGHGTSTALPTAGQIARTVESIGPGGEIRWSDPRYVLGLAPSVGPSLTERCPQETWTHEGHPGGWPVTVGGWTDENDGYLQSADVAEGRMSGSYREEGNYEVRWSICRSGTECPPLPEFP
jgi:hypothetical protein